MRPVLRLLARWRPQLVAAVALALGGTLFFGTLHALLIEPIWLRLAAGVPFGLLAAAGMIWCWHELSARRLISAGPRGGALFGAAIWLALLPMTAVAAALRESGLRARLGGAEAGVEIAVAAATGFLVGFAISRSSRSLRVATACAACMTAVVLAMAGPIAVTVDATRRFLLLGFLPIFLAAGAALSLLLPRNGPEQEWRRT